ncbi:all-trans-retinol 13,14-reductase-like [Dysidea avara]|uniref:all-trans-retinol 13,14-reductase-like n=1 Tax=Dysidea avara TaxID=196820 RepID=UPI003328F4EB
MPIVKDSEKRKEVLKQLFSEEKIPDNLDAIVIGSGIGGLTVAAILSRAGKRVLVLEQRDQAGGCCHTFIRKGYEFDIGIHYVGGMSNSNPSVSKVLLDQISDGQIRWEELDKNYDTVHIRNSAGRKIFDILSTSDGFVESLTKCFPKEVKAIKK